MSIPPVLAIIGTWELNSLTINSYKCNFSSLLSVAPSPVVPPTNRPSEPCEIRYFPKVTMALKSIVPSSLNGVTIAVIIRPNFFTLYAPFIF